MNRYLFLYVKIKIYTTRINCFTRVILNHAVLPSITIKFELFLATHLTIWGYERLK